MASKLKLTELLYPTSTTPAITINADDTVTFGAPTTTITNLSATSITDSGNLTFTGTGNRIRGDFGSATVANRVAFQTSIVNDNTAVNFLPNGTAAIAALNLVNNSDPTNSAFLQAGARAAEVSIRSSIFGTGTYLPMTFFTGGSEAMRIGTDRNVVFGSTTTTAARLAVVDPVGSATSISFLGSPDNQTSNWRHQLDNVGYNGRLRIRDSSNVETIRLAASGDSYLNGGNVGIGVTPSAWSLGGPALQLVGGASFVGNTARSYINANCVFNGSNWVRVNANYAVQQINDHTDGAFIWNRAASGSAGSTIGFNESMRIDSSGNLLVGVTTVQDGSRLQVRGSGDTSGTKAFLVEDSGGNDDFFIRGDGEMYSLPTYNRTSASASNVGIDAGGGFFRSTSSIKYKTDVNNAPYGLAELLTLRPVTYKGKNDGDTVFGGLIAEEVHEAGLSEFVQYAEDGTPDALAYGNMVSLCIKAIQQQQALIQDLTTRLNTLEGN